MISYLPKYVAVKGKAELKAVVIVQIILGLIRQLKITDCHPSNDPLTPSGFIKMSVLSSIAIFELWVGYDYETPGWTALSERDKKVTLFGRL